MATGGFASSLTLLYLSTTSYPVALQGIACGMVGILGADLIKAIRVRMFKEITGETPPYDPEI